MEEWIYAINDTHLGFWNYHSMAHNLCSTRPSNNHPLQMPAGRGAWATWFNYLIDLRPKSVYDITVSHVKIKRLGLLDIVQLLYCFNFNIRTTKLFHVMYEFAQYFFWIELSRTWPYALWRRPFQYVTAVLAHIGTKRKTVLLCWPNFKCLELH